MSCGTCLFLTPDQLQELLTQGAEVLGGPFSDEDECLAVCCSSSSSSSSGSSSSTSDSSTSDSSSSDSGGPCPADSLPDNLILEVVSGCACELGAINPTTLVRNNPNPPQWDGTLDHTCTFGDGSGSVTLEICNCDDGCSLGIDDTCLGFGTVTMVSCQLSPVDIVFDYTPGEVGDCDEADCMNVIRFRVTAA